MKVKQRAKSLPTGIGGTSSTSSSSHIKLSKMKKSSNDLKSCQNRSTNGLSDANPAMLRLKRITKSDISTPCNLKHIISIKTNEKDIYYTLSKLLPAQDAAAMSSPISSNSIESRCSSSTASSCSPTSSSSLSSPPHGVSARTKKLANRHASTKHNHHHSAQQRLDFVKVSNSTGSPSLFINKQIFMASTNSCNNFLDEKI